MLLFELRVCVLRVSLLRVCVIRVFELRVFELRVSVLRVSVLRVFEVSVLRVCVELRVCATSICAICCDAVLYGPVTLQLAAVQQQSRLQCFQVRCPSCFHKKEIETFGIIFCKIFTKLHNSGVQ